MFRSAERAGCAIHAYVLMSNHVHMLVTPSRNDSAARMMRRLGAAYVRRFNDRHGRTGTLWEGRFRSVLIESERYFFACSRYIELNPVRAGMVADAADFTWSSFRHNALGKGEDGVRPHWLYQGLGATVRARAEEYRALFREPIAESTLQTLRGRDLAGDPEFKRNVAVLLRRRVERLEHGGDRRSPAFGTARRMGFGMAGIVPELLSANA